MKEYIIEKAEHQKILILTDLHYNAGYVYYNTATQHRMDCLCDAVQWEYEHNPFDAILCLGDYSLDFWGWYEKGTYLRNPSVSNTKVFVDEVLPRFPMYPYLIPGNHEQYGNEKWVELTGYPRQFSVVYGDYVFLMCDTFAGDLDPTEHSDGTYTGLDADFLREALEKYPDKKLFLCMHELDPAQEPNTEARDLIVNSGRFLCGFAGHIHESVTKFLGKEWGNFPVFYCGDFSYSINQPEGSRQNWGFRRLNFAGGFATNYQPFLQLDVKTPWGQD